MKRKSIRYSVRDVPESIDQAIRHRAAREKRSVNQVVISALRDFVSGQPAGRRRRDLSWFIGNSPVAESFDRELRRMRKIDPEDWK